MWKIQTKNWLLVLFFPFSGGKEVLLNLVAMAIPNYTMQILSPPHHPMWWTNKNYETILVVRHGKPCNKYEGRGHNFKDVKQYNLALLAKQEWRLITKLNSLLFKVLRGKYFPNSSFLEAGPGSHPSWSWRGIYEKKSLVKVWDEPWLNETCSFASSKLIITKPNTIH